MNEQLTAPIDHPEELNITQANTESKAPADEELRNILTPDSHEVGLSKAAPDLGEAAVSQLITPRPLHESVDGYSYKENF